MKLRIVMPLPFDPDRVLVAMSSPQFHVDAARGLGASSCELLDEGSLGDAVFCQLRLLMPNPTPLSGPLAKLIPAEIRVGQRNEWDVVRGCGRIAVTLEQAPVRMEAEVSVQLTDEGCEHCFDWEIHARIPVMGKAIERLVAQNLERSRDGNARVMAELIPRFA